MKKEKRYLVIVHSYSSSDLDFFYYKKSDKFDNFVKRLGELDMSCDSIDLFNELKGKYEHENYGSPGIFNADKMNKFEIEKIITIFEE